MNTVKFLLLFCCFGHGIVFVCGKRSSLTQPRPNIVFILADDLGWDDVGFHGSDIRTPNIDKLAREGVILDNYYVQPLCTPTRSAILTGKYPIHTGMQHYVIAGSQPYGLPLTDKTLAQHLKARGYSTHAVGKWHLGFFKEDYLPTRRGFDSHLGYYLGKEDYFDHTSLDGGFSGYDFHFNGKPLWNQSEVYSTEIFSSQADAIIRSHNKSMPLFLYMAHQAAHSGDATDPIQVPQKYIDRFPQIKNYKRRLFAGVVSALDDSVGQLYQSLRDRGMADNTIIIFSTDNGGPTNGYDRNAACNWPLRGCKATLWQGGVRGVGFVHSPLMKKSKYINHNMMHAADWLPTILSAVDSTTTTTTTSSQNLNQESQVTKAETSEPKPEQLDGVNQWGSISTNSSSPRREVLLNIDPIDKMEGIIVGDFKLVKGQLKHGRFDGWYPPPTGTDNLELHDTHPDTNLDFEGMYKNYMKSFHDQQIYMNKTSSLTGRMTDGELRQLSSYLDPSSKSILTGEITNRNLNKDLVKCGPKPASTNCHPEKKACLFHLTSDPCEFNNLAHLLPGVLAKLEARLDYYRSTMIPPGNKPVDPKGNPQLHGGVWQPWL